MLPTHSFQGRSWLPRLSRLAALALLLFATTARAQDGQVSTAPLVAPVHSTLPRLGAMLDAGLPDGATASLVYRPFSWLRTHLGGGYNMISKSVRGGISLLPFGAGPSATLEGGHFFEGNANGFVRDLAGAGFQDNALLQRVGYDYANAHLGLDFGMRRVTFFIHGGMSYIRASVHNLNSEISSGTSSGGMGSPGGTTVSFNQDPVIKIFAPSVKLGLVFYIW